MNLLRQIAESQAVARADWLRSANRLLPYVVTPLLVVTIAYELAQLTWSVVPASPEALPPSTVASSPAPPRPTFSAVVTSDLFGPSAPHAAPATPPPEDAPDTALQLKLTAWLYGENGQPSGAIISEPQGREKSYSVGDEIEGTNGTKLYAVYGDRVLLSRDGQLETLRAPEQALVAAARTELRTARRMTEEEARDLEDQRADEQNERFAVRDDTDGPGDSGFDDADDRSAAAAAVVARVVQAEPEFDEDRLVGFKLDPGPDRAAFEGLGLRPGDIVTAINGVAAGDERAGLEVTEALASSAGATLTVKRGGAVLTLPVSLAPLLNAPPPVD